MEKRRRFIINTIYALLIAGIVYLIFKYAIFIVMPFLLGFLIAALINPPVRYLSTKFDLNRRPTGILILLIFYATIGMLITIIVVRLVVMFGELSSSLPDIYTGTVEPAIGKVFDYINGIVDKLDGFFGGEDSGRFSSELGELFTSVKSSLGGAVSDISVKALTKLSSIAASIPGVIVELLFAVISSFFFTIDYESILSYAKKTLPTKTVGFLTELRSRFLVTIGRYFRSYALIMLITFAELSLGLMIIGADNPFFVALSISLFDILPVLGTGGIMVPWAAVRMIAGDYGFAIGLIVIWVIISIVRNIIEPKIVGKQVGLHPLATLIAMFVGTKLFGIIGLFLLPMSLAIAISLVREKNPAENSSAG
ncbi:MAG: sporulation integral membrane protein YtvI [Clostridiales bacterium]|nr:sporulation integral membrane protein YtvI [Clostridiales bacterium]